MRAREVLADVLEGAESRKERRRDYAAEDAGRSNVLFQLRVKKFVAERADQDAQRYGMNRSAYVAALILGAPLPPPSQTPGTDALLLTLAANPVLRAIVEVQRKIGEGEVDAASLIPELRAIQRAIAMGHLSLRAAYDTALDERKNSDTWHDNESPELPLKRRAKTP